MQDRPETKTTSLYDTDFFVWCHEQARLVREGRFAELDIENVAEELESMARSDKRQIRRRLKVLVAYLLKWRYQPGFRTPSWRRTIRDQREEIVSIVKGSPSLKGFPES